MVKHLLDQLLIFSGGYSNLSHYIRDLLMVSCKSGRAQKSRALAEVKANK